MTKQPEPDRGIARDRPVELKEFGQPLEAVSNTILKLPQGGQDGEAFKGLSLAECYVQGVVDIILKYDLSAGSDIEGVDKSAIFHLKHDSACIGLDNLGTGNEGVAAHWQDALMLVSDVELMEIPKIVLPTNVRLNIVKDVVDSRLSGAVPVFYMSSNGVFHPFSVFANRKLAPCVNGVTVSLDQDAVCVVKGSPEIMDGIAKNGWRMASRLSKANRSSLFESALLIFGAKSFSVFRNVSVEKRFKLVDVLVGPFYLE